MLLNNFISDFLGKKEYFKSEKFKNFDLVLYIFFFDFDEMFGLK